MKNNPRLFFWIIIAVTVLAILIDMPQVLPIRSRTTIPLIQKPISINTTLYGFQSILDMVHISRDFSFHRGLDLEGGTSITLQADMKDTPKDQQKAAIESVKSVIERRVNLFGVSEPVVQTATVNNQQRIIVELPGVTDLNAAVGLVGTTAKLEFRQMKDATTSALPTLENTIPTGLSGADLKTAQASFNQQTGAPVVTFQVIPQSQQKFFNNTQKLVGKPMVIFLDTQVISAPVVQEPIRDNGQISGNFTSAQVSQLATLLNAGSLRVPLKLLNQQTIGATLGESSLEKSLFAGIIGFIVVVIFMVVLYGRLGVVASFALILYTLFILAIFKLVPVTLTLAGIAGFVLSIGMAVDANILIFERMKEELRAGKSRHVAIELGFSRAWTSIRDSNISSLITSAILFQFGTGIVRGFALTLAIGVLVSMFSAIVVTKTFLRTIYR